MERRSRWVLPPRRPFLSSDDRDHARAIRHATHLRHTGRAGRGHDRGIADRPLWRRHVGSPLRDRIGLPAVGIAPKSCPGRRPDTPDPYTPFPSTPVVIPVTSSATPDQYDLICQSTHGAIQRCRCCASVRVRFGNLLLGLNDVGFQQFCDAIVATRLGAPRHDPLVPRRLGAGSGDESVFYLGESGVGFVVTATELEELDDLLQHACGLMSGAAVPAEPPLSRLRLHRPVRGGRRHA